MHVVCNDNELEEVIVAVVGASVEWLNFAELPQE